MRVVGCAADFGGCAFYRLELPAQHAGVDVQVRRDLDLGFDRDGNVVDVRVDADVVVLQRPTKWRLAHAVPVLQAKGVAVVVEMDDDFTCIDPANPTWAALRGTGEDERAARWAARHADLVTVTTPALVDRYGRHGRVAVLPNYVPAAWLDIENTGDGRTVGWAGSVATHPNDLTVTRGGVAAAVRDANARFKVVGDGEKVASHLGLTSLPTVTGIVPLDRYPLQVATFDVGVVPLADTAFNRAKSGLKLLEYTALGVVGVASPTPDNQRLHRDGIGLLARNDWRRQVTRALTDADLAEQGRAVVRESHTFEVNGWRWAEAWARAILNRRLQRSA